MSIVIDADMKLFADRLRITSSRMIRDYGLSNVDEIIEKEAERGNTKAIDYAKEYYYSPDKLINIFRLTNVENKYRLIRHMDESTRANLLPMLSRHDLVMGLYFFTQEKLLKMLMKVDIKELVSVVKEAFPPEQIIMMLSEEDLAGFFMNKNLERQAVMMQLKVLPHDVMQKFLEGVTGKPAEQTNPADIFANLEKLSDEKFAKFMSAINPDVQRQLAFQLTKVQPEYFTLFNPMSYLNMLNTLDKPEMVKPMIMLDKESMIGMISELPPEFMSIVAAQIDTRDFAEYLQDGNMDLIEKILMI